MSIMPEEKEFDLDKEYAFICEICGTEVPNNEHWRIWSVFIGEICKPCRLDEISRGITRI